MFSEAVVIEMIYETTLKIWKLSVCVGYSKKTVIFLNSKFSKWFYPRICTLLPSTCLVEILFKREWVFYPITFFSLIEWKGLSRCEMFLVFSLGQTDTFKIYKVIFCLEVSLVSSQQRNIFADGYLVYGVRQYA